MIGPVRAEACPLKRLLCTDQWLGYRKLDNEYPHAIIDHAKGQYVIGAVHTQTIEDQSGTSVYGLLMRTEQTSKRGGRGVWMRGNGAAARI
jgi:hypothetical protein